MANHNQIQSWYGKFTTDTADSVALKPLVGTDNSKNVMNTKTKFLVVKKKIKNLYISNYHLTKYVMFDQVSKLVTGAYCYCDDVINSFPSPTTGYWKGIWNRFGDVSEETANFLFDSLCHQTLQAWVLSASQNWILCLFWLCSCIMDNGLWFRGLFTFFQSRASKIFTFQNPSKYITIYDPALAKTWPLSLLFPVRNCLAGS